MSSALIGCPFLLKIIKLSINYYYYQEIDVAEDLSKKIRERKGFSFDKQGNMLFEQCNLEKLASEYGTPCYVYSENIIRESCREYKNSLKKESIEYEVIYAGKAFLTQTLCKIIDEEGLSLDASSGGEIYIALSAGFPAEKIYFHGNNKSADEIGFAIRNNVGNIVIDNYYEIDLIADIAQKENKTVNILVRVTPGVNTHTHSKIRTGQIDSKFGFPISDIERIFYILKEKDNLLFKGLHCHIGSQLLQVQDHLLAVDEMVKAMKSIIEKFSVKIDCLNLGGGFGAKYTAEDMPISISDFASQLINEIKEACSRQNIALPKIMLEPGRSIVAEAGIMLYRIGPVKEIPGLKKYLLVDGGMTDNPRPSLYDAKYEASLINKYNREHSEDVTIAGKCCESGDILIQNIKLPKADSGDLVVFFTAGAYQYSMSSNYNGIPRPPVVLVNKGKHGLMVKRETYEQLTQNQVYPEWLTYGNSN